jgi:NitT/TauT family transport system ATP-binding protein
VNKDNLSISLENIEKKFITKSGTITALNKISLTINRGEFCVIVGPSGCGKTTLLRILAGLDTATKGEMKIFPTHSDRPINSMVFQEQSIFPWMTVRENVAYGLKMRGIAKSRRTELANYYIHMIGLDNFSATYPHQLSGGMKQRVSVARAFANDPEILLMDEPFGALDEQNRMILQQELLKIWEKTKKTTVFITHSIDEALCLGDRIIVMTAHPGTVKTIIPIDLPRPREIAEIRTTLYYNELFQKIWYSLKDEVIKVNQHTQQQSSSQAT